jgi:hypothetical protein
MQNNFESVQNWIKLNKVIFWRVIDAQNKDVLFKFPAGDEEENSTETVDNSIAFFGALSNDLPKGIYTIAGRSKKNSPAGEVKFTIVVNQNSNSNSNAINGVDSSILDAFAKLQSDFAESQKKSEIEKIKADFERKLEKQQIEFEKKINAQKQPQESKFEKYLPLLAMVFGNQNPAIAGILGQVLGQNNQVPLNSIPNDNKPDFEPNELDNHNNLILQTALDNLGEVLGEDLFVILYNLSLFAKAQPETFLGFASQFKPQNSDNQEVKKESEVVQ